MTVKPSFKIMAILFTAGFMPYTAMATYQVENGSFEYPVVPSGNTYTVTAPTDWSNTFGDGYVTMYSPSVNDPFYGQLKSDQAVLLGINDQISLNDAEITMKEGEEIKVHFYAAWYGNQTFADKFRVYHPGGYTTVNIGCRTGGMARYSITYIPDADDEGEEFTLGFMPISGSDIVILDNVMINCMTRGHKVLLQRGLQIEAMVFPRKKDYPYTFTGLDEDTWEDSKHTTVTLDWAYWNEASCPEYWDTEPLWSRILGIYDELQAAEEDDVDRLVRLQYKDEPDLTSETVLQDHEDAYGPDSTRSNLPYQYTNAILCTNVQGGVHTQAQMENYMERCQPHMLMYDTYLWHNGVGGSNPGWYRDLETYRFLGLEGNDGDSKKPIPVGAYMQTYVLLDWSNNPPAWSHTVSESQLRCNFFTSWAFGHKLVSSFTYDAAYSGCTNPTPVLFSTNDDSSPTTLFSQLATVNQWSQNIGDSLVRLISTDGRIIMGKWLDYFLGFPIQKNTPLPDNIQAWNSSCDPYITSITAVNYRGIVNDDLRGDVIIGYFKPLDPSFTNDYHEDDIYFMIVNGLTDETGSGDDCLQEIRINFDFGNSGITQLKRKSRTTGNVETVPLVHDGGTTYHLYLYLDGGTGDLFKFDNGGTFVSE